LENEPQRKLQRERLLASRAAMKERDVHEQALRRNVAEWLTQADPRALAFYWPIRAEPDLRDVVADWLEAGTHRVAALPAVSGPILNFIGWTRHASMRAAEFNIPVPAHGRPVQPDALLIPCVGFDAQRYRLGYGGGYYDRTLSQTVPWPLCVGIAFECGRLDSIDRQPHDMQLDVVITDSGIF
jgi:5-formyltetrahydrofolate cyclo-ligase